MKDGHMRMSIYDNSKINSNKIISCFCVLSVKCLVLYVVHPCIVRSALCNVCVLSILYIMFVQCLSCVESVLCSCTGCVLSFLCGNSVPFVRVLALWYRFACCLFVIRPYFSVCCSFCCLCAVPLAYCLCNVSLVCSCMPPVVIFALRRPSCLLSVRCPSVDVCAWVLSFTCVGCVQFLSVSGC